MQKHTWMMFLVIPVISQNYFMQKASYMQVKLIADTIIMILCKKPCAGGEEMNRNALFLLVSTLLGAEDLGQKISSRRTRIGVVNREKPIFWKWLMKTVILFFLSLKHTLSKYHFLINMIMYSFVSGYVSLIALGCNGTVLRRSSMIGQTGGKIESEGYFDNNNHFVRHGCSKHWNEEGTLIFRAKYTHDVADGRSCFNRRIQRRTLSYGNSFNSLYS